MEKSFEKTIQTMLLIDEYMALTSDKDGEPTRYVLDRLTSNQSIFSDKTRGRFHIVCADTLQIVKSFDNNEELYDFLVSEVERIKK